MIASSIGAARGRAETQGNPRGEEMADDPATTGRIYIDRLGRPISDPSAIEARKMLTQLRRLVSIGVKAGKPWHDAVTVAELARASHATPQRVVDVIRGYDVWLWSVVEKEGPVETWGVFEDGE
jgi:hypothetical protein